VADGPAVQFGSQGGSVVDTGLIAHKMGEFTGLVGEFFGKFNIYDILGFVFVMFLGLLVCYIAIVLRKRIVLAIFMFILGICILGGGPFLMDKMVDSVAKKTIVSDLTMKQLQFTDALVVHGKVTNLGKVDFKSCKIIVKNKKKSSNKYKQMILNLSKPHSQYVMSLEGGGLTRAESRDFKFIVNGFKTDDTLKTEVEAVCD
jgi:hypothetical protein